MNKYKGVEDTLFIPLTARIYVSKRFPEFFYDQKALEFEKEIDNSILNNSNEYTMLASCARYYRTDKEIKRFCQKNELSNVIFLGAGLETAYNRINDKINNFYEIDLENVIEIRKELIGESKNDILISGDMFKLQWTKNIDLNLPTLIVVNGVFQYFKEKKIIKLINDLKNEFNSELEIIFDATNERGLKFANKYVKKTGNKNALMYFYINSSDEFVNKLNNVKLINEFPFFKVAINIIKHKIKFLTKIYMKFADTYGRVRVIHLKIR